jgi:D-sedoheptulose 7-phosphate isomerase
MMLAKALASAIAYGNKGVIIAGNGGSMAQAQHMAAETIGAGRAAMALSDPAVMSALANDGDYDHVFTEYLRPFEGKFGYFVGLTTSGSPNIVGALAAASMFGMKSVMVTGTAFPLKMVQDYISATVRFPGTTQEVQEKTLEWIHVYYEWLKEEVCRSDSMKLAREVLAT